ncbi:Peptidyl-prolyl cis-trans isomerase cyp18 [compost metagenome]
MKNNDSLNAPNPDGYGYTVFGKVVAGTDVVDKIRAVQTGNKGGMQNVPVETLTIKSATLAK